MSKTLNVKEFYNSIHGPKKLKPKTVLNSLYAIPKKDKGLEIPKTQIIGKNVLHQADLLFLPTDQFGFKYCLVVVDLSSKKCDAVPIKTKTAVAVRNGFKKLYARKILEVPISIRFDSGTEFKGEVTEYFTDQKTTISYALPNRHRQNAFVEQKNKEIGSFFAKYQAQIELNKNDKKYSKTWVKELPQLIEILNENAEPTTKLISNEPIFSENNKTLIPLNTNVRTVLNHPIDLSGKKLHGNFRSSDIRFSLEIKKVTNIILNAGLPPLYQVDNQKTGYTFNQLQVIE
jgi:hypothetical protein